MTEYRLQMNRFKSIVTRKSDGDAVYSEIKAHLNNGEKIIVDFSGIDTMTTYFAKQVFGKLYMELGAEDFSNQISFEKHNMSADVELVLRIGISGAIAAS